MQVDDSEAAAIKTKDDEVTNSATPPLVSVFRCFMHDPKAWFNKWRDVQLAIGNGLISWASSAEDAAAALLKTTNALKKSTCVAVLGRAVEALEGKLDGKDCVLCVELASSSQVRGSHTFKITYIYVYIYIYCF
jgi:hypothetical protein